MTRIFALLLLAGCTPSKILVREPPRQALASAEQRLTSREVVFDAAGARPDRLRTATFCWPVPDERNASWDGSFGRMRPGPVPFTVSGSMAVQDATVAKCPYLFQLEITAKPAGERTELIAQAAWWRVSPGPCETVGDPLVGEVKCSYSYAGATAPADAESFIYGC